jgi:hypothetical protein
MADDVLFEIQWLGNSARATAIDGRTGIEATIVAPAGATELEMRTLARRKLDYLLKRRLEPGPGGGSNGPGRGGIVV